jgi:hypothetical protein
MPDLTRSHSCNRSFIWNLLAGNKRKKYSDPKENFSVALMNNEQNAQT